MMPEENKNTQTAPTEYSLQRTASTQRAAPNPEAFDSTSDIPRWMRIFRPAAHPYLFSLLILLMLLGAVGAFLAVTHSPAPGTGPGSGSLAPEDYSQLENEEVTVTRDKTLRVTGTTLIDADLTVTGTTTLDGPLTLGTQATLPTHAVRADRTITAGDGLIGGGDLTADRTLSIDFGSLPGTAVQGDTTITIDAGSGLSGGGTLTLGEGGTINTRIAPTPVTPDTYGSSTRIPTFTVNDQGRLTRAGSTAVDIQALGAFVQGGNSFGELTTLGTNDAHDLALKTDGTERLRITTSGNTGIGTDSPANTLDVSGGIDADTINTGQGDNELYAMDQNLRTSDSPAFNGVTLNGPLSANGAAILGNSTDDSLTFNGTIQGSTPFLFEGATNDTNQLTLAVEDPTADVTYRFLNPAGGGGTYDICTTDGNCTGADGGTAPHDAEYVTLSLDADLTAERVLTAGTNIEITDGGADGNVTVNVVDNPTIAGDLTVNGATSLTSLTTSADTTIGDGQDDQLTVNATLQGGSPLRFEGATANTNETTFAITDPTADRTITFPDVSGEVSLLGQIIENSELANDSLTVTAGNGLSGGGSVILGGSTTLTAVLGADIESSELVDGTIQEVDFSATNAPTDEYVLTYDAASGGFTWVDPSTQDSAGVDSLNTLTGDLTLQGTADQISVADNGSDTLTLSTPQDLATTSSPTFGGLTVNGALNVNGSTTLGDGISDQLTLNATLQGGSPLRFEGATANTNETTFAITDPTADRTITFPDVSGEVSLLGQIIDNAELANDNVTYTAGTGLTGGGTVALGGSAALDIATGNGIQIASDAVALGPLTGDWNQTGAFDIVLNNSSSELRMLESGSSPEFFGTLDIADLTADRTYNFPDLAASSDEVCIKNLENCIGDGGDGSGAAPADATYVTLSLDADLSNERALDTGASLNLSDGGANANVTLNTVQNIQTSASPTFSNLTLQGGTATLGQAGTQGQLVFHDGGSTDNTGTLQVVSSLAQDTVYTIPDPSASSDEVCLVGLGNCAGSGDGVTTSGGTTDRLAKFTSGQNIEDASLLDDGTTVSIDAGVDLTVDSTSLHVDATNDRVGIGTASPSQLLHVAGNALIDNDLTVSGAGAFTGTVSGANATANDEFVTLGQINDGSDTSTTAFVQGGNSFGERATLGTNDAMDLRFITSGNDAMLINTIGNVGIGTTGPSHKLDVDGDISTSGALLLPNSMKVQSDDANRIGLGEMGTGGHEFEVRSDGTDYANAFATIGTNVRLNSNGASYLDGGNVGIGNTNPQYAFDVTGDGHFTDSLTFTGSGTAQSLTTGRHIPWPGSDVPTILLIAPNNDNQRIAGEFVGARASLSSGQQTVRVTFELDWRDGADEPRFGINATGGGLSTTDIRPVKTTYNSQTWYGIAFDGTTANHQPHNNYLSVYVDEGNVADQIQAVSANDATGTQTFYSGSEQRSYYATRGLIGNTGIGTVDPNNQLSVGGDADIAGNLGINTATPSVALDVVGSGAFTGTASGADATANDEFVTLGQINDGSDTSTTAFVQGGNSFGALATLGTNDLNELAFETNNTERVRINANGNVGIGTTNPARLLHMNSGTADVVALFESSDGNAWIGLRDGTTSANAVLLGAQGDDMILRAGGSERVRVDATGNVGIGTANPGANLDINGDFRMQGGTHNAIFEGNNEGDHPARLVVGSDNDPGQLDIAFEVRGAGDGSAVDYSYTNDSADTKFAVLGDGTTLIGYNNLNTNSFNIDHPYQLDVNGDANISGDLTIGAADLLKKNNSDDILTNNRLRTPMGTQSANTMFSGWMQNLLTNWDLRGGTLGTSTTGDASISGATNAAHASDGNRTANVDTSTNGGDAIFEFSGKNLPSLSNLAYWGYIHRRSGDEPNAITLEYKDDTGTWVTHINDTSPTFTNGLWMPNSSFGTNPTQGVRFTLSYPSNISTSRIAEFGVFHRNQQFGRYAFPLLNESNEFHSDNYFMGNIGLGTISPTYKLDVQDGTGITGRFSGRVIGGNAVNNDEFVTLGQLNDGSSTSAFVQGGNSFGSLATLGTNDANALAIETSGTERIRVDTSGNVGIGTTTPDKTLDVAGDIALDDQIQFYGTSFNQVQSNTDIDLQLNTLGTGDIRLQPGDTEVLRATNDGNVGVGTTNPGEKLEVAGDVAVSPDGSQSAPDYTFAGDNDTGIYSNSADILRFTTGGTFAMHVSSGRVGIRTTSPSAHLQVAGNAIVDDNLSVGTSQSFGQLTLGNNQWITGVSSDGTSGINMMKLNTDNHVQLGSSLAIDGGINFPDDGGLITFTDMQVTGTPAAGDQMGYTMRIDSTNLLGIYAEADGSGGIQNSGIGIGTATPSNLLDIATTSTSSGISFNGASALTGTTENGWLRLNQSGSFSDGVYTPGNIRLDGELIVDNGGSRFVVKSGGNVGIGTSTPATALDVAGQATISGVLDLTVGNGNNILFDGGDSRITAHDGNGNFNIKSGVDDNNNIVSGSGGSNIHLNESGRIRLVVDESTAAGSDFVREIGLYLDNGAVDVVTGNFQVDGGTLFADASSNNVGIGTTSPSATLHTEGVICADDGATAATCSDATTSAGDIIAENSITANAFDVAELYGSSQRIEPATVVAADSDNAGYVTEAQPGMSLLGIVSTEPGLQLGWETNPALTDATHTAPVTLSGRVPVKVTDENGSIAIGDTLTLSGGKPGYATKATAESATTIGIALSAHESGTGEVQVFVNLDQHRPSDELQTAGGDRYLQNGDSAEFAALNVSGETTLNTLTVTNDATFEGQVTVKELNVGTDITVGGHIISRGDQPDIAVGEALALDTSEYEDQDIPEEDWPEPAEATIEGTETAGTIQINTNGITIDANQDSEYELATIEFGEEHEVPPRVVATAKNADSAAVPIYVELTDKGFVLKTVKRLDTDSTYEFDYHVISSETAQESN